MLPGLYLLALGGKYHKKALMLAAKSVQINAKRGLHIPHAESVAIQAYLTINRQIERHTCKVNIRGRFLYNLCTVFYDNDLFISSRRLNNIL
jgi:hypothetical protein